MHKPSCSVWTLLRIGRPYYVLPAVASAVAGTIANSAERALSARSAIVFVVFGLLGTACWTVNEVADRSSDASGQPRSFWGIYVSGGTGLLSSGAVSAKAATVSTAVLSVLGVSLACSLGFAFAGLSVAFLLVGLTYSLPPLRLKARGAVGLTAVAVAHGILAFGAGWVAGGSRPFVESIVVGSMLATLYFGFEGVAHLLDENVDRRTGVTTTAVSLGERRTRVILACCQSLPGLGVASLSHVHSATDGLRTTMLVVLASISAAAAMLTVGAKISSLVPLRVLSVPILCAFAFVIV